MVTRIITRRIISSKERTAAEEDSNRDDVNRLKEKSNNKQGGDKVDDSKEGGEGNQLCSFKTCQNKAAGGGNSYSYHDVFFNDDATHDDGKVVDIQRDSSATRKRPLITDDTDGTEQKGPNHLLDWTTHFDFGQRRRQKFIDLTDVPAQPPIISSRKNGTSKYEGVSFYKANKKWAAKITLDGKTHYIGSYDIEEKAAIDYARAVFKYEVGKVNAPRKRGQQNAIDLTDVPSQPPILKSIGMGATSKYRGVYLHKPTNKWRARIEIDGKRRDIGSYAHEEQAAVDYARAMFKYNKV